jgi:hypothetical protein
MQIIDLGEFFPEDAMLDDPEELWLLPLPFPFPTPDGGTCPTYGFLT